MSSESRYGDLPILRRTLPDGTVVPYRSRRFLPTRESVASRGEVTIDGARLDQVAALRLGDPGAWWRLCDANAVMAPDELELDVGRSIRVPLIAPEVRR